MCVANAHGLQIQQLWWCVLQDARVRQLLHRQAGQGSKLRQGLLQEALQTAICLVAGRGYGMRPGSLCIVSDMCLQLEGSQVARQTCRMGKKKQHHRGQSIVTMQSLLVCSGCGPEIALWALWVSSQWLLVAVITADTTFNDCGRHHSQHKPGQHTVNAAVSSHVSGSLLPYL